MTKFKTFVLDFLKTTQKHFYMAEEDVIDINQQHKNFRRTTSFRKNEPILLATFVKVKKYLGKFMFALPPSQTVLVSCGYATYTDTRQAARKQILVF